MNLADERSLGQAQCCISAAKGDENKKLCFGEVAMGKYEFKGASKEMVIFGHQLFDITHIRTWFCSLLYMQDKSQLKS